MKQIELPIAEFDEDYLFEPLRDPIDYARVILHSTRILLMNLHDVGESHHRLKLVIDKMSRLFFYKEEKYFSVSMPFTFDFVENEIVQIYTKTGLEVDSRVISDAISVIENKQFQLYPICSHFLFEGEYNSEDGVKVLEEILAFEPGYLRYDHDPNHVNGNFHPLHHLDFNFSSPGTYKVGLDSNISNSDFESLVNIKTECSFLKSNPES